jgi:EmrB/QacA subfamily drug resistance transporter
VRALSGGNAVASGRSNNKALLVTASLVSALIMLDSNIVAVALPAIGRSLTASFTDIQWVISAYVLTYAALLMASGNFADLYGRRKTMIIGLLIFAAGSVGCGLAGNAALLDMARAVQGAGGAFLLTASLAIISNAFDGEERSRAFAVWGAALGLALAVGPVVGGAITSFFGWRWVFWVNLPLALGLIGMTRRFVPESHDPDAKGIDWLGVVTFSPALALLIWALIDGNDKGWTSTTILARFGGAVLLFIGFVLAELRQDRPMVDLTLFRRPAFQGAVAAMVGYGASAQMMVFFLPLFLQNAYGFSPLTAGLGMLPFALPMVLAPHLVAKLAGRYSGRVLLASGLGITLVGNVLFFVVARAQSGYAVFVIAMLVAGAGAGLLNGQTVKVLGVTVPPERAGMASGLASTTRFLGILVAVGGFGAVLAAVSRDVFLSLAVKAGVNQAAALTLSGRISSGGLAQALSAMPHALRTVLLAAGVRAFSDGFAALAFAAAVVAGITGLVEFLLLRGSETSHPTLNAPCKAIDCRNPL